MSTQPRAQCDACVHFRSPLTLPEPDRWERGPFCAAFPDGIPDLVYGNVVDHREPIAGDNGVQFEARAGDEFPAYAFTS